MPNTSSLPGPPEEKQVTVRAADVYTGMKLKDRMPAVASALGAKVFETTYRVRCVGRTGPHNGPI